VETCRSVLLLDGQGQVRLAAGSLSGGSSAALRARASEVMRLAAVRLSDIELDAGGTPYVEMDVPVGPPGRAAVAVLVLRLNPHSVLEAVMRQPMRRAFRITLARPGPGGVLVLQSGDRVSHLPYRPGSLAEAVARPSRQPVQIGSPESRSLAMVQPTRNSPWKLVAEVDQGELYSGLRRRVLWMAAAASLLMLIAAGIIALLLNSRERHAAREHQALSERYAWLARYANDGILVAEEGTLRIVDFNERAEAMYGYTREEFLSLTLPDLRAPGAASPFEDLRDRLVSEGGVVFESMHCRKDGTPLPVEVSARMIHTGGARLCLALMRDITERKRAADRMEAALAAAREATELASMSHELRTPLNAIIGFSEVLKEQFFGPLADKQEEYVDDILESGKHLLSIINDILDLSKVEAGKMDLDLVETSVADLIGNSLVMVKEKAAKHRISIAHDIAKEVENLVIAADQRKLKQVLYNLLSNAEKFTPDGGSIRLTARVTLEPPLSRTDSPAHAAGNSIPFLEISVSDTGIGIDAENLEKVFDPFFQVEGSRQGKTPGTGLGLPLSRELIELHGGTLWGESEGPGKGSTFKLRLPLARDERKAGAGH